MKWKMEQMVLESPRELLLWAILLILIHLILWI